MSRTNSSCSALPRGTKTADIVFLSCVIGAVLYLLWLSPYGISSSDEAFYLTIPYRLAQGDVFFVDEWHPTQLSGFLLYPLMKLFLWLVPEKEGMLLSFRYFYVATAAVTSIYIYIRGKRFSTPGAMAAALFILLYCPFCIKTLSYNSMVVLLLSAACITAAATEKHGIADMVFAGLCSAGAVLCNPYLAVLVVFYVLAASVFALYKKSRNKGEVLYFPLSGKGALAFCGGVFTLFVLFCVFVFSRTTIGELIEFFPWIFNDPEHVDLGWLWYIKNYVLCVVRSSEYSLVVVILYFILTAVMLFDRNRMRRRILYVLFALALSIWYVFPFLSRLNATDAMLPINFLGFYAFCLAEKRNKRMFYSVFIMGLLCSFCLHHGSTQRYHAICNAAAVCSIASAFFIAELAKELLAERKNSKSALSTVTALLISATLVLQVGAELYVRSVRVYNEPEIGYLNAVVPHGVQKGLISTSEKVEAYEAVLADTQEIREANTGYVLYISQQTWLPLADNKRTAGNTGWTFYENAELSVPLLLNYLRLHPEKYPSFVYVTDEITYSYKPAYDGKLIIDAINTDGRAVEKTATGYTFK